MKNIIIRARNSDWTLLENKEDYDAFSSIVYSNLSPQLQIWRNCLIGYYPRQANQINMFLDGHPMVAPLESSTI